MTFQIGDRVRIKHSGKSLGVVGIVGSQSPESEDYDYYVKSVIGTWYAAFRTEELEFIAHAPNSLDHVSNEEWNASQTK